MPSSVILIININPSCLFVNNCCFYDLFYNQIIEKAF
jgi:hypothetical protein